MTFVFAFQAREMVLDEHLKAAWIECLCTWPVSVTHWSDAVLALLEDVFSVGSNLASEVIT